MTFPDPLMMTFRLIIAAFAFVLGSALLVCLCAYVALPFREDELLNVVWFCAAVSFVALVTLGVASMVVFRGLPSVYRSILGNDAPLADAVQGAFWGPSQANALATISVAIVVLVDMFGWGPLFEIEGRKRIAVDVLVFGVFQAGLFYIGLAWRVSLWHWLSRIRPEDISLPTRSRLAQRFALRVTSAFVLLGSTVVSVPLAYLATVKEVSVDKHDSGTVYLLGAFFAVIVIVIIAVFLAWRLGKRLAADLDDLKTYVLSLSGREWTSLETMPAPPRERMRTKGAEQLALRIRALSNKYVQIARDAAKARRAIENMQRLKARFMAFMSHDLRSPLNSITGFADVLAGEMDGPLNYEQRASVEAIRDSGQVLVRLVTDIVDTARIEAGRLRLARHPTSPVELLGEAIEQTHEIVRSKGLKFDVDFARRLPEISVDRDRAVQALVGVLSHIARVVPEGVIRVAVRLKGQGKGAFVRIKVDAEDLPLEDTQRIFLAFREIRRSSGRRVGGLGLGLALARTLVVAHGGELYYEGSESSGAKFTFDLPVSEESLMI